MAQNQITGTEQNDFLVDSSLDDEIIALGGNDDIEHTSGNDLIDGGDGNDELTLNYSSRREDLRLNLQSSSNYSNFDYPSLDGSIEVNADSGGYNNRIDFNNIEEFSITTGRGNDFIELGYDNISDDEINAGGGNDYIYAGLGNDTIDGGAGFDTFVYQLGDGTDIISDDSGSNDTISLVGMSLNDLSLDFNNEDLVFSFTGFPEDRLIIDNYVNSLDSIETIEVEGQIFSIEEIIESRTYPVTIVDNGSQLVANYSDYAEDLEFILNSYDANPSLEIRSLTTGDNARVGIEQVESFEINSGSGNDFIDTGYDYFANDEINAGAGDDSIAAGRGNDTINGGRGSDRYIFRLGDGVDTIFDSAGQNDTIYLDWGITFDNLRFNFDERDLVISLSDSPEDRLIIDNYVNSLDSIETIEVEGRNLSIPLVSLINNNARESQLVANYSDYTEDLEFILNPHDAYPSLDIRSLPTGDKARVGIEQVESFEINSGSGNDFIETGYDYFSDDEINAGAGDDMIVAGWGNDTIDGGEGSDRYFYQLGHGVDVIFDSAGEKDTIYFDWEITLDSLDLYSDDRDLTISLIDSPEDYITIKNYVDSVDSIENIEIKGEAFSIEEIIELKSEPKPEIIGEFGKVDNFNHNSQTIKFDRSYENPVVFALPLSLNESDPSIVRMTDIQSNGFAAYLQEAEYKDGIHTDESFSYLVLEAGTWELGNGSLLEVGTVDTNLTTAQGWNEINFDADFADTPVILSQVQTNKDSEFVRTRQSKASIDGFSLSLEEEEALRTSSHDQETVGWLAIDASSGGSTKLAYQAGHTGREIDHGLSNIDFTQKFVSEPSLFASLSSFYGSDAAGLRYQSITPTQASIMLEEDQSRDSELIHTKESVDFLAIAGTGDIMAIAYEPFI